MGANVWNPPRRGPAEASEQRWYLHSSGHANSAAGDGALSEAQPSGEPADHYVYDPLNPAPTVGGPTLMHSVYRAGPIDQRLWSGATMCWSSPRRRSSARWR